jgi:ornithine carbamoyltransferase
MERDLISLQDFSRREIESLLKRATRLKEELQRGKNEPTLAGKTLGLLFEKASTRTRVSFQVGMVQLGGSSLFLSVSDLQLGRGEPISDTARVLSRYLDGVVLRTVSHQTILEFARYATVPVINGLSDLLHPCQILADLLTILEARGTVCGIKVAYVGDGNNVANSWVEAATKFPFQLTLACPKGYGPDKGIMKAANELASIELTTDPEEAAADADVLYTDVWVSMGDEVQEQKRRRIFKRYQLNDKLLEVAKSDVLVLHCLPAHREEEITGKVLEGHFSIIMDQAENRLHIQKAVLEALLG